MANIITFFAFLLLNYLTYFFLIKVSLIFSLSIPGQQIIYITATSLISSVIYYVVLSKFFFKYFNFPLQTKTPQLATADYHENYDKLKQQFSLSYFPVLAEDMHRGKKYAFIVYIGIFIIVFFIENFIKEDFRVSFTYREETAIKAIASELENYLRSNKEQPSLNSLQLKQWYYISHPRYGLNNLININKIFLTYSGNYPVSCFQYRMISDNNFEIKFDSDLSGKPYFSYPHSYKLLYTSNTYSWKVETPLWNINFLVATLIFIIFIVLVILLLLFLLLNVSKIIRKKLVLL